MTPEQKAAFVNARAATMNAEVAGMVAENKQREQLGNSMAYVADDFQAVSDNYLDLSWNSMIEFFRE